MKYQNQLHPPRNKAVVKDNNGNLRYKMYLKVHGCTMLFTEGITPNAAKCLEKIIDNFLGRLGLKKNVTVIVTK